MHIEVTRDVVEAIRAEAYKAHPEECCGILLAQDGTIHAIQPARNVHPAPATHFEIDPQVLINAHRSEREGGARVVGYYHSHPKGFGLPSDEDTRCSSRDGKIWAIHASGETRWWQDDDPVFAELELVVPSRGDLLAAALVGFLVAGVLSWGMGSIFGAGVSGATGYGGLLACGTALAGTFAVMRALGYSTADWFRSQLMLLSALLMVAAMWSGNLLTSLGNDALGLLGLALSVILGISGLIGLAVSAFFLARFRYGSLSRPELSYTVVDG